MTVEVNDWSGQHISVEPAQTAILATRVATIGPLRLMLRSTVSCAPDDQSGDVETELRLYTDPKVKDDGDATPFTPENLEGQYTRVGSMVKDYIKYGDTVGRYNDETVGFSSIVIYRHNPTEVQLRMDLK